MWSGYAGRHELTHELTGTVRCQDGEMSVKQPDSPARHFLGESPDVFFDPAGPGTRRILPRDAGSQITVVVDRREDEGIAWNRVGPASEP